MIEAMKKLVAAVEAIPEDVEGWMPDALTDALIDAKKAIAESIDLDAICQDLQEKTYTQAMRIAELEAKLAEKQEPVTWGVDLGKAGDTTCVSIIKRLLDGRIEVVAAEYAPYTHPQPNVTTSDMKQEHVDKTAKQRHEWVGLTDDEVADLGRHELWIKQFIRTVEAKLKEKNT
jgi:hypothetical protein